MPNRRGLGGRAHRPCQPGEQAGEQEYKEQHTHELFSMFHVLALAVRHCQGIMDLMAL
ncbi:MAG TPA: hypothetical protein VJ821_03850 [Anaerolineales bacterium]|nr:hypothetical protein [Anaerolineales bacterium]